MKRDEEDVPIGPERDDDPPRRRAFTLFRIRGIGISVDFSWFIIFLLVLWSLSAGYLPRVYPGYGNLTYWLSGLVATFFFFASILVHELMHSFMAMHLGIKIPDITFFIFGGVSRLSQEAKTPQAELKIALAGPLSSFALALLFWGVSTAAANGGFQLAAVLSGYLGWINVVLGVFNLVPGFPMDGGRVLRSILWLRTGSLTKATRTASSVGRAFGALLMLLGGVEVFTGALIGGLWLFFIGWFLRGMAAAGYQELAIRKSLESVHVRELMIEDMIGVPYDLTLDKLVADYFFKYHYRGFPVLRDGKAAGIVSLSNVRDIPADEQSAKTVGDVMRPLDRTISVSSEDSLAEALTKMTAEGTGRLLVLKDDKAVGMITKASLMRFLELKSILGR